MPPVKQEGGMAEVGVFLGSHCGPAWKSEGHGPMVTPIDGSPMPEIGRIDSRCTPEHP